MLDADGLLRRNREASAGIALLDGQIAASMTRRLTPREAVFTLVPYRLLDARERAALGAVADQCGQFYVRAGRVDIDG